MSDNSDGRITDPHSVPPYDPETVNNVPKQVTPTRKKICKRKKRNTLSNINEDQGQGPSGTSGGPEDTSFGTNQTLDSPGYSAPDNIATSSYASGTGYYNPPPTADPDILGHGSPQDTTFNMTSSSGPSCRQLQNRPNVTSTYNGTDAFPVSPAEPRMNTTDPQIPFQSFNGTTNDSFNSTGSNGLPAPTAVPIAGGCYSRMNDQPYSNQTMNQTSPGIPTTPGGVNQTYSPQSAGASSVGTLDRGFSSTGSTIPSDRRQSRTLTEPQQKSDSFNGLDAPSYANDQRLNQTDPGIPSSNFDAGANQTISSGSSSGGTINMTFNDTGSTIRSDRRQSQTLNEPQQKSESFNGLDAPSYANDQRLNQTDPGIPTSNFDPNQTTTYSSDGSSSAGTLDRAFNATGSSIMSNDGNQFETTEHLQKYNSSSFTRLDTQSSTSQSLSQNDTVGSSSWGTLNRGFNATGSTAASDGSSSVGTLDRGFNATGSTTGSDGPSSVGTLDRGFNATGSTMPNDRRQSQTLNPPQQYMSSFNGLDARPCANNQQRLNQTDPGIAMSNAAANQTNSGGSCSSGIINMAFNDTGSSTSPNQRRQSQTMNQPQQVNNSSFSGVSAQPYPNQRLNQTDPGIPMCGSQSRRSQSQTVDQGQANSQFLYNGRPADSGGPTRPTTAPSQADPNSTYEVSNRVSIPNGITPIDAPHMRLADLPPKRSSQSSNNPKPPPIMGTYDRDTSTPSRPYYDNYRNFDNDQSFMISAQGGLRPEERQAIVLDRTYDSVNPGAGQTYVQSPDPNYQTLSSGSWSDQDAYMKQNHPEEYINYEVNRDYMKSQPGMLGGRVPQPNAPPSPLNQTQGPLPAAGSPGPNSFQGRNYQGPNATFAGTSQGPPPQQRNMNQSMPNPQRQGFDPNASGGAAGNISGLSNQEPVSIDISAEYARLLARYPQSDPRDYIYGSNPNRLQPQRDANSTIASSPGGQQSFQNRDPNASMQNTSQQGYTVTTPQPLGGANESGRPNISDNFLPYYGSSDSSNGSSGGNGQDPNRSLNILPYYGSPNSSNVSGQVPNSSNLMAFNTNSPDGIYQLKVVCMWNKKT